VNLTEGVNLQGWVLNITALVEDLPLSQYVPRWSLEMWGQIIVAVLVAMFSTRWVQEKLAEQRYAGTTCSRVSHLST